MVIAELSVRHTRRHMPTRRVALGSMHLPMAGPAPGAVLLRVLAAQCAAGLDEDQRAALRRLLLDARDGLGVPRIALRHRLQTDVHGLDRSRHRLVAEGDRLVAEIDVHGRSVPQLIGAVMAAATLRREHRRRALGAVELGARHPGVRPDGVEVRFVDDPAGGWSVPLSAPRYGCGAGARPGSAGEPSWEGVAPERRWAMEVLGFTAGADTARAEVQRRFRRLTREAHPDHGGIRSSAAMRLAELADARSVLLDGGPVPA